MNLKEEYFIKPGDTFARKSKYSDDYIIGIVDEIIPGLIINDTFDAIQFDIKSTEGIIYSSKEIIKVLRKLDNEEIANRKKLINYFNKKVNK